jgi:hypothetical protein
VKIVCLVLAIYVALLSVKPCCTDSYCQVKTPVDNTTGGKLPVKQSDCAGCSPFFTCGSCSGFILNKPVLFELPIIAENSVQHNAFYRPPAIQQITLSIWQPPKLS